MPGCTRRVEAIEIIFVYSPFSEEVVVLLSSRYRRQNVERRKIRLKADESGEVFFNTFCVILWKTDNVREMCGYPIQAAYPDDLTVEFRVVLCLVRGQESFAIKRLHTHKYLAASSS